MKILIVFENIPESTHIYILDVTPAQWEWMQILHGKYVNVSQFTEAEEEASNRLGDLLESVSSLDTDKPIPMAGIEYTLVTGWLM
jgi:hypothetical protein